MAAKGFNKKYPSEESRMQARRDSCKQWRTRYPRRYKSFVLQKVFGIDIETFDKMWKEQKGKCAICKSKLRMGKFGHAVDHCHKTGKVRGLLCAPCNTGIGNLKDNLKNIMSAYKYIKKYA